MKRPSLFNPTILCDARPCPNPALSGPCHVFRGTKTQKGYGQISIKNKSVLVHRLVWEREIGPIPKGLEVDHQCRVKSCCNVDHLRIVTQKVNLTENVVGSCWQLEAAKTHCPRGHPYDEANTYYQVRKNRKGPARCCRACNRHKQSLRRKGKQL